jgi:hypothetical protein
MTDTLPMEPTKRTGRMESRLGSPSINPSLGPAKTREDKDGTGNTRRKQIQIESKSRWLPTGSTGVESGRRVMVRPWEHEPNQGTGFQKTFCDPSRCCVMPVATVAAGWWWCGGVPCVTVDRPDIWQFLGSNLILGCDAALRLACHVSL